MYLSLHSVYMFVLKMKFWIWLVVEQYFALKFSDKFNK